MTTPTQASSAGLYDKFYYNSATYGSPTWVEVSGAQDVDLGDEANDIAIKIRQFRHELHLRGQKKKEITFNLLCEVNKASWIFINNAYNADPGTVMDVLVMIVGTSATSGSIGFRMQVEVHKFGKPQKLEDGDMNDVVMRPSARVFGAETTLHEPAVFTVA